jgi:uncharacterized protein (DUF1684 family)
MSTALFASAMLLADATPEHKKEVDAWRSEHEASYRREYVALAGLFFLTSGANTVGSDRSNAIVLPRSVAPRIGTFVMTGKRVRFEPMAGANVMMKNVKVASPTELKSDEDKDGPDELQTGGVSFWVHGSGDRIAIRLKDEKGEPARTFAGFRWFPIDDSYRVVGRFIKDAQPRKLQVLNQLGDIEVDTTEGVVEFTLGGQKVQLRPMTTRPGRLWFTFRDGTSGKETYATARFLYSDLKPDGTTVLNFNEAYNPPCAFNPYTTCPLPLAENRLKIRIPAGERAYAGH